MFLWGSDFLFERTCNTSGTDASRGLSAIRVGWRDLGGVNMPKLRKLSPDGKCRPNLEGGKRATT